MPRIQQPSDRIHGKTFGDGRKIHSDVSNAPPESALMLAGVSTAWTSWADTGNQPWSQLLLNFDSSEAERQVDI